MQKLISLLVGLILTAVFAFESVSSMGVFASQHQNIDHIEDLVEVELKDKDDAFWQEVRHEAMRETIRQHGNIDNIDDLTDVELETKADAIWEEMLNQSIMVNYEEIAGIEQQRFKRGVVTALILLVGFYVYFSNSEWKVLKILKLLGSISAIIMGVLFTWVTIVWWSFDRSSFDNGVQFWMSVMLGASHWVFIVILGFLGVSFEKKYTALLGMIVSGVFLFFIPLIMLIFDFTFYDFRLRLILYYGITMVLFMIQLIKKRIITNRIALKCSS